MHYCPEFPAEVERRYRLGLQALYRAFPGVIEPGPNGEPILHMPLTLDQLNVLTKAAMSPADSDRLDQLDAMLVASAAQAASSAAGSAPSAASAPAAPHAAATALSAGAELDEEEEEERVGLMSGVHRCTRPH